MPKDMVILPFGKKTTRKFREHYNNNVCVIQTVGLKWSFDRVRE